MQRAIILAAGFGSRLVQGRPYPKPLEAVCGQALIVRVIRTLAGAGVDEVVVIVGHLGDVLRSELEAQELPVTLHFVQNDEYDKPNGTSLLKAADYVEGPTLLLMSDHLFSPDLVERVLAFELGADEAVLGVDHDIEGCFDLDDATKVLSDGDRIAAIGKTLDDYDCLDVGVFRITPALIAALRDAEGPEGCSLSAGVGTLAKDGRMRIVDVGDAKWIDVDTPEAHAEAERLINAHGPTLK